MFNAQAQTNSSFLGVMLHDCKMPFENHGLVCLTDPTPAVIYPVSSNEVRALISFPNRVPPKGALRVHVVWCFTASPGWCGGCV